jgi:3-hydroxyisobutyrate dehydrogenase-like beta-hydroxyacid dehydrogenase
LRRADCSAGRRSILLSITPIRHSLNLGGESVDVGFIGTGHMGNPIVRHLLSAGHHLAVHDKRQEATANLLELGAAWADSPRAAAEQSQVMFTSLPGPVEVDEAVSGPEGLLAGALPGSAFVDLTTTLPSASRRLAAMAAEKDVRFLDVPLSGMVTGAEAGTLTVFAGGDAATLEVVRPLLATFASHIFHVGGVGNGNIVKLTNNIMIHGSSLIVQECLALGAKAGLDPRELYEIWNVSSSSRFVYDIPFWLEQQYEAPAFTARLTAKDAGLAVEAGRELGVPMPVASAAAQVFLRAVARGYGDLLRQGASLLTIQEDAGVEIVKNRWKQ